MSKPTLQRLLHWVGGIGLFLWLLPNLQHTSTLEGSKSTIRLGWPSPPWLYLDREHRKEGGRETRSLNWKIEFLSWSWACGLVGCAATWGARRMRQADQAEANSPVV